MNLSRKILAGAVIALLPLTGAMACTTGAWVDTPAGNLPTAEEPFNVDGTTPATVRPRVAQRCALQVVAADKFVNANNGDNEGNAGNPFRARVYVYTGWTGGTPTVLRASSADNGGGTQAFAVKYNPAGSFDFELAAGSGAGSVTGILANRWYGIEVAYQAGTPMQAFVRGGGSDTELQLAAGANAPAVGVSSVRVGIVGAASGSGRIAIDEYDSSRGASRIGFLCRGDGGSDGDAYSFDDVFAVLDEFLKASGDLVRPIATGSPDGDQSGAVDFDDVFFTLERFLFLAAGGNAASFNCNPA